MGIFSRRHAPEPGWCAETQQVGIIPVELMNDPLAAGEFAYGIPFSRPDNDAVMNVWAYAQHCGTAEGYIVAFRVDRMHEEADLDEGDCAQYADPAWAEWFRSADTAEANAMQAAALLLAGDRGAALSYYAEPDVIAQWFDCDGVPG